MDSAALHRANRAQQHRGPDQAGTWVDTRNHGPVGLAAVRLAVLDPTSNCNQPFSDPTGRFHVAYNGELYNYREIRPQLSAAGYVFRTNGDTEVLLAACMHWGTDALSRMQGMWAFAFYDTEQRSGFLARDRFGEKPLLYASNSRQLLFSSEMSGLRALEPPGDRVDPQSLVQLLRYGYVAAPRTILADVSHLEPGHYLPFSATTDAPPVRYYRPAPLRFEQRDHEHGESYGDSCRRIRGLLEHAVVAQRVSDVPIGAYLSGGLDSSIVTHHLRQAIGGPVDTFSLGYAGHSAYDESRFAKLAAKRIGTQHHPLILSSEDIVSAVPKILDHLSEPVGDSSIIPTALVARHARQFVTVALSGDGGDELFGGYWRYLGHRSWEAYHRLPAFVRKGLLEPIMGGFSSGRSSTLTNRVRQFRKLIRAESDDALTRHLAWSRILAPEAESIFRDADWGLELDRDMQAEADSLTQAFTGQGSLARIMAFDVQYSLPSDMLHKVDTASMMRSLEVRVPFLDPNVVESALGLPTTTRIDRGVRKRILIDAYRGLLPDEILDRPKQGFEVPVGELFRGPLTGLFRDVVTKSTVESFGLLSFSEVEGTFQQHLDRRTDHADLLFALLSLCWWRGRRAATA